MQEDQFSAAERILCDIETVFKKDTKLREFDIIPVKINQNKSPVIHVDHCLGLESWCIRHIYCYVYHHIMDSRQSHRRREDPSVIGRWLLGALLINPDVSTFWNMRKQLIVSNRLDVHTELHYTAVILSRKPKSAEAFAHRKWLSEKLLSRSIDDINEILERELAVSENASNRYANNYHAWTHRTWCLTRLAPHTSNHLKVCLNEWQLSEDWIKTHVSDHSGLHYRQYLQKQLFKLITKAAGCNLLIATIQGRELMERSITMLNQYVSVTPNGERDPSTCGQFNKKEIHFSDTSHISPGITLCGIVVSELINNADLILRFSGHEALWCHRRFLITSLKETLDITSKERGEYSCKGAKTSDSNVGHSLCTGNMKATSHMNKDGVPLEKDQKLSHPDDSDEYQICCLLNEMLVCNEYLIINQCTGKEVYQGRLANQHQNWLSHVMRVDVSLCRFTSFVPNT